MVDLGFRPTTVSYTGLFADQNLVDAQELGRSLVGIGRLANSITHLYLHGQVVRDSRSFEVKYFAGPPQKNGLLFEFSAIMVNSQLPMYSPIFVQLADVIVPRLWEAVISKVIGRPEDTEKALNVISEQAAQHHELALAMQVGHLHDKKWLQDIIGQLVDTNRQPLREIPAPVGSSCAKETILARSVSPVVIDEAAAQALKSTEKMTVGDAQTYEGIFEAVDATNGSCKLKTNGDGKKPIRGKITDPALAMPENVYTHTFDLKVPVVVTAKPVLRDGEIHRLYISDARKK